jgi:purine-nucleoside phosphorylase
MANGTATLESPGSDLVPADKVEAAVRAIRGQWSCDAAATAVILGTGLGELADEVRASATLSYRDIPGFCRSTALAHKGRLVCGELGGSPVIMLQGRCHGYEGYSLDELTFPVSVLAALGVKTLIVTNAAGGLNPNFAIGDVMLIDDHINLMNLPRSEFMGQVTNQSDLAPMEISPRGRFYDRELANAAATAARRTNFILHRGVYVAVSGPSYETRAEYRAFRRIGGDAVGMSTVPEVLAAADHGLRVLGLSTITNVACPDAPQTVTAEEVVEVATIARPRVGAIIEAVL